MSWKPSLGMSYNSLSSNQTNHQNSILKSLCRLSFWPHLKTGVPSTYRLTMELSILIHHWSSWYSKRWRINPKMPEVSFNISWVNSFLMCLTQTFLTCCKLQFSSQIRYPGDDEASETIPLLDTTLPRLCAWFDKKNPNLPHLTLTKGRVEFFLFYK